MSAAEFVVFSRVAIENANHRELRKLRLPLWVPYVVSWCRVSGCTFVFVDEAAAAGRSDESKGHRVVSRVVVGGGVTGRPFAE